MDRKEQMAEVFAKLTAGDAEGFLRAAGHALVDPLMDGLIVGLRGPLPIGRPAGAFAAAPTREAGVPPALPADPARDLSPVIAQDELAILRARIETLESANRGLEHTIVEMSRAGDERSKDQARTWKVRAQRSLTHRRKASFTSLVTEPGGKCLPVPAAPADPNLVDIQEAAHIGRVSVRSISYLGHRGFPAPVSRRGRSHLWRRIDIEIWARKRLKAKDAAKAESVERPRDREKSNAMNQAIDFEDAAKNPPSEDLIDMAGIAQKLGCSKPMVRQYAKSPDFPKLAAKLGRYGAFYYRRQEVDAWIANRVKSCPASAVSSPKPDSDLLNSRAVANLIGCSLASLYQRISLKQIPTHSCVEGNRHLWRRADIEAWMANRGQRGARAKSTADSKTCSTCADRHQVGQIAVCRSEDGPHRNQSVKSDGTCDFHRRPGNYMPIRPEDD